MGGRGVVVVCYGTLDLRFWSSFLVIRSASFSFGLRFAVLGSGSTSHALELDRPASIMPLYTCPTSSVPKTHPFPMPHTHPLPPRTQTSLPKSTLETVLLGGKSSAQTITGPSTSTSPLSRSSLQRFLLARLW